MILTKRDRLQLTPKEIKTSGSYKFKSDSKVHYCNCPTELKINHWPENCRLCGKRARI